EFANVSILAAAGIVPAGMSVTIPSTQESAACVGRIRAGDRQASSLRTSKFVIQHLPGATPRWKKCRISHAEFRMSKWRWRGVPEERRLTKPLISIRGYDSWLF